MVDYRPSGRASGGKGLRLVVVGRVRATYKYGDAIALEAKEMGARDPSPDRRRASSAKPEADPKKPRGGRGVVRRAGRGPRPHRRDGQPHRVPGREGLVASFESLRKRKRWQHFWDRQEYANWDLFFAEMNRWFHENKDEEARANKMRDLIAASLDDSLEVEDRLRAIRVLK